MYRHHLIALLIPMIVFAVSLSAEAQEQGPKLGRLYEDQVAGIALRPPASMEKLPHRGDPNRVVEFVDKDRQWVLRVDRTTYDKPTVVTALPGDPPGVMDRIVEQFTQGQIHVEVLRQDLVNHGTLDMGLLAMRYGPADSRRLAQQAIIRANPLVFYTITFNSPTNVPIKPEERSDEPDPLEREAVEIFNAVIDSVQILDRRHIKEEQDRRLMRTRALLPNFNEHRLTRVLIPEQWLRIVRDGEDIGYSYVVEETYNYGQHPGVLVVIRSRLMPQEDVRIDTEKSMFISFDRRHGFWTSTTTYRDGERVQDTIETGTSDQRTLPVVRRQRDADGQPARVEAIPEYLLSVSRTVGRREQDRIVRHLPPYYLPMATAHLLPRLLPLNEPQGYLFVGYVSDQQELMFRYIDVEPEQDVTILGHTVRAVPIYDRWGLQGNPTIHYVSPDDRRYLGSQTITAAGTDKESTTWIIPSDARTLESLWKDATLTRPDTRLPDQEQAEPSSP